MFLPEINSGTNGVLSLKSKDCSGMYFGVFDGMGGQASGEKAAYLASKTFYDTLNSNFSVNPERLLLTACENANKEVNDRLVDNMRSRSGTTAVAVIFNKGNLYYCNVGDSQLLLVRDNVVKQLTVDHNESEMFKKIYGNDYSSDKKFRLTQYIGVPIDEMIIEPFVGSISLEKNDKFILCSDGFSGFVNHDEIISVTARYCSNKRKVKKLSECALKNGSDDNITIIYCEIS